MRQTFLLILIILNLTNASCQTEADLSNIKGTELYLLQTECRNQNPYNEYKTKSGQKAFIDKYQSTENIPDERCAFYINLEDCKIESKPLLNKSDIEKFDWKLSKIYLTNTGIKKLKDHKVPLNGLAFVLKLNGENIYGGWLWNMASSFGCDRVWTYQNPREKVLQLQFGLGGFKCGTDPRTDEKLIKNAIENPK